MELIDHLHPLHELLPDADGNVIRHQLPRPGIFPKRAADFALEIEQAKDVAGGGCWKKPGIAARIFPWVPLPLPGAPKRRIDL